MSDATTPSSPLEKLHDIIVVDQVSAWPPAPIWYIVLLITLAFLTTLYIYLKKQKHYKKAKKEAVNLSSNIISGASTIELSHLNELQHILKRLTKHYYGTKTAALTGKKWARFVSSNCNTLCEDQAFNLLYQAKLSDEQVANLKSILINSIKKMNINKNHINSNKGSL
ncbi:hypothetical protein CJF42_19235 [Pseudoalteromonas sp. NBT06-2]|uniref:DUF4381 domain-containing protein n=1 Tax=Pseudoalteromonas sp. NBT06-2 TaxID=2025950 RepID=UPI000BA72262|nr:DUF4381 domain-containing protein [Pseudoalteromonas sp. NBT06-2]PAJ72790.1 hypothetical protein CJF42_19235 [Pseudoalteromonas sp. NBT06-2]